MERQLNPFVITKKTVYMQRISDAASRGSTKYISGTIPVEKAGFFAAKMNDRYELKLAAFEALRKRKLGYATAKLIFWHPEKGSKSLNWILLITNGKFKDDIAEKENWIDLTTKSGRIKVTNYVLFRNPSTNDSKPRWTWKYSRYSYDGIRNNIVCSIRDKNDKMLREIIYNLFRSPSFAGVREQVKEIVNLIKDEWKRTRGSDEKMPEIPKTLGYVRRLSDKGVRLTAIRDQLEKIEIFSLEKLGDMSEFYD